ncbi:MAG: rod shape-determining protein MreC [Anaerolineaceae bacterium]|nr:rod shape-determining protein MreC [Anaerolineaceae bacterium]
MNTSPPRHWRTAILILIIVGVLVLALSGYLNSAIRLALDPFVSLQYWLSSRYQSIYEFLTVPREVAFMRQRNVELENEVSRLQKETIEYEQQLREAQVLYALLDFARARPENVYVAAAVIGRDPSPFMHYVIIDHGSDNGIRYGMPVVTEQGLVGRVDAVLSGAARVQLITGPDAAANIRFKSSEIDAMLVGSLTGDLIIEMIPQDIVIESGELVLTSGLGGNYPIDVLIGQVVSVRKLETDLFQTAAVQPAVDFSSLRALLVITNFRPVDISPLIPTLIP